MDEIVCFKSSSLSNFSHSRSKEAATADVTLISIDGTIFPAHGIVLAAASPLLKSLLLNSPGLNTIVHLPVSDHTVLLLLNFIYDGKAVLKQEQVQELNEISTEIRILELTDVLSKMQGNCPIPKTNKVKETSSNQDFLKVQGDKLLISQKTKVQYFCDQCSFAASLKSSIGKHIRSAHQTENFVCNQCSFEASSQATLKAHFEIAHNGKRYVCSKCNYRAKKKENLKLHIEKTHEGTMNFCSDCNFKSSSFYYMREHKEVIHGGKRYQCSECEYEGKSYQVLRRHMGLEHNIGKMEIKCCTECSFRSHLTSLMREHIDVVHEGKRYICENEKCDYFARSSYILRQHVLLKH